VSAAVMVYCSPQVSAGKGRTSRACLWFQFTNGAGHAVAWLLYQSVPMLAWDRNCSKFRNACHLQWCSPGVGCVGSASGGGGGGEAGCTPPGVGCVGSASGGGGGGEAGCTPPGVGCVGSASGGGGGGEAGCTPPAAHTPKWQLFTTRQLLAVHSRKRGDLCVLCAACVTLSWLMTCSSLLYVGSAILQQLTWISWPHCLPVSGGIPTTGSSIGGGGGGEGTTAAVAGVVATE
jgi:hypothetical protein